MAAEEPVTSPDQHKPQNLKLARWGAVISAAILVIMALFGNREGAMEQVWVIGIAALLLLIAAVDWVLRRRGLR